LKKWAFGIHSSRFRRPASEPDFRTRPGLLLLVAATIGGGMTAFPTLKNEVVGIHHWLTEPALIHLYSVGQMAPGPNMMIVACIGEKVAGPLGSLVVVLAFFVPTALITFIVGRLWVKLERWR